MKLRKPKIIWVGSASRKTILRIGEIKIGRKKRFFESLSRYREEILNTMRN